ncbi:MAG: hypothetical protein MUF04_12750, partial [Akkermansiaceae bacterium]|nr:hypothetical protein [Akkermansiaceae bacterium]
MKLLIAWFGMGLIALPVASRLLVLAPSRTGWVMYLANVALETVEKRLPFSRWWAEYGLIVAGCLLLFLASGMAWLALLVLLLHLLLVLHNLLRERAVVNAVYAEQESVGLTGATADRPGYPAPGL